jgi:hypothetical protein
MSSYSLAFLLIFGIGHHPAREPMDPAKGVQLHSRIPCDGNGAPEDLLRIQTTFSAGDSAREFVVSSFANDKCELDVKGKCLHNVKAGWRTVWSDANAEPSAHALVPISSCYEWGSSAPAQYVLSGWYKEGAADSKPAWKQAPLKQVSAEPEVYQFTDPNGGTGRLEIRR